MSAPPSSPDDTRIDAHPAGPGFTIPDHELLRRIGSGAYGDVWLARSVMGTYRAVKVVFRNRFRDERPYLREFEGIRRFEPISRSHEGFLDILQIGRPEGQGYFYCVMELADPADATGPFNAATYEPRTLSHDLLRPERIPFEQCLTIGLSLSSALGHLHSEGLVHRDVKPANVVFIGGVARLADIGLVTLIHDEASFVGSPGYIPPEGPGSPQADIYSLGKVLYQVATGKDCRDFPELPESLLHSDAGERILELNEIIVKACHEDHRQRYQTAAAVHSELEMLQGGKSVKRLRVLERRLALFTRVAILGMAAILVIGVLGFQIIREGRRAAAERQRKVGAAVVNGTIDMEEGDLLGALPWFCEALALDTDDPGRQATHRLRIGSVLQRCPKPIQMWFFDEPLYRGEFCPVRDEVLLSTRSGHITVRDFCTAEPIAAWRDFTNEVGSASYSPDGRWILTIGIDARDHEARLPDRPALLQVWNATNARLAATIRMPVALHSARFNPTGHLIVAAASDNNALVVDWSSGEIVHTLRRHTAPVLSASFNPDGRRILTSSKDSSALLWDAETGESMDTPPLRQGSWIYEASFSPDGKSIATACFDRSARVWDAATGLPAMFHPLEHRDGIHCIQFSPDGRFVLTGSLDFTARLWNARTGQSAGPTLKHSGRVMHATFSADGRNILTVCWDGTARVWRLPPEPRPELTRAVYAPDGSLFAEISDSSVRIASAAASNTVALLTNNAPVATIQFSADARRILTVARPVGADPALAHEARLWDAATGRHLAGPFLYDRALANATLSPRGDRLAAFGGPRVLLWNTRTPGATVTIAITNKSIWAIHFDRAGGRLAILAGATVAVHDARSGELLFPPLVQASDVRHADFSPDGELIVTACASIGSLDHLAAQVWDARTGQPVGTPLAHRDGVLRAHFAPDSRRIVTASEDFTAVVWEARTSRQLLQPLRHADQVHYAAFTGDGSWIITASQDQAARVWDATTGEPVTPALGRSGPLRFVEMVADGRQLLIRRSNGEMLLWTLGSTALPAADLHLMSQLLSGRQRDYFGTMVPQTREALRTTWEDLRARYPSDFSATPTLR